MNLFIPRKIFDGMDKGFHSIGNFDFNLYANDCVMAGDYAYIRSELLYELFLFVYITVGKTNVCVFHDKDINENRFGITEHLIPFYLSDKIKVDMFKHIKDTKVHDVYPNRFGYIITDSRIIFIEYLDLIDPYFNIVEDVEQYPLKELSQMKLDKLSTEILKFVPVWNY